MAITRCDIGLGLPSVELGRPSLSHLKDLVQGSNHERAFPRKLAVDKRPVEYVTVDGVEKNVGKVVRVQNMNNVDRCGVAGP